MEVSGRSAVEALFEDEDDAEVGTPEERYPYVEFKSIGDEGVTEVRARSDGEIVSESRRASCNGLLSKTWGS